MNAQYNEEISLGIPESTHFKNLSDETGYLVSEIGYIDVILVPLFEVANSFAKGALSHLMDNITKTREIYERELQVRRSKDSNNDNKLKP